MNQKNKGYEHELARVYRKGTLKAKVPDMDTFTNRQLKVISYVTRWACFEGLYTGNKSKFFKTVKELSKMAEKELERRGKIKRRSNDRT